MDNDKISSKTIIPSFRGKWRSSSADAIATSRGAEADFTFSEVGKFSRSENLHKECTKCFPARPRRAINPYKNSTSAAERRSKSF